MEKVCICIPTYNRGDSIAETIKSLINQTYSNIHIIVCDNSSDNDSRLAIERFNDNRITYIYFKDYLEVNYNFLRAIQKSDCEYVALFHSDDWYYPTIIEEQLNHLKGENVGAVFSLMNRVTNSNELKVIHNTNADYLCRKYSYFDYLKLALVNASPSMNCPTFMTKKSVLLSVGLLDNPSLMISDMSFWLSISRKYLLVVLQKELMNYYVSEKQLSHKIAHGGKTVVSPSFIILDSELKIIGMKNKIRIIGSILIYKTKRIKEIIAINRLRKQMSLRAYNFFKYAVLGHQLRVDSVSKNEADYLSELYKKGGL